MEFGLSMMPLHPPDDHSLVCRSTQLLKEEVRPRIADLG
jgi:hypothetical protein